MLTYIVDQANMLWCVKVSHSPQDPRSLTGTCKHSIYAAGNLKILIVRNTVMVCYGVSRNGALSLSLDLSLSVTCCSNAIHHLSVHVECWNGIEQYTIINDIPIS